MPSPRKPASKRRGFAPRRYNVLSAALGSALSVEELTSRMDVFHDEAVVRSELLSLVIANLLAEKIHAAVARHWLSTLASRDYLYTQEKKAFESMVAEHRLQLKVLRASVAPQKVQRMIHDAVEEELLSRKRIILLEQKMFDDFFVLLGEMLLEMQANEAVVDEDRDGGNALEGSLAARAADSDGQIAFPSARAGRAAADLPVRSGKQGLVHLCDGCPFIHIEDCPFYAQQWISRESFIKQHAGRRLPRLKHPFRLEQISYDKYLQDRESYVANMNLRLFQSKLLNA